MAVARHEWEDAGTDQKARAWPVPVEEGTPGCRKTGQPLGPSQVAGDDLGAKVRNGPGGEAAVAMEMAAPKSIAHTGPAVPGIGGCPSLCLLCHAVQS